MTEKRYVTRRSLRLDGYDYSQNGAYFVTICAANRACIFGQIENDAMYLNDKGDVLQQCWNDLPQHYRNIVLDEFIIMPNHVHGIIVIYENDVGAGLRPAREPVKHHGLPEIMRAFKSFSTRRVNELRNTPGISLWQRGYYEHIIRNENALNSIRLYIQFNPVNWTADGENPASSRFRR